MPEITSDPRPINETEGKDRKTRDRAKKRNRKLSTRNRNRVGETQEEEDAKVGSRFEKRKRKRSVKNLKRKLSEKDLAKRRRVAEKRLGADPPPKKEKSSSRKYKKNYCDMTKDEIVNLCFFLDRPRARLVADDLRKYLIQVSESAGFDCDVFPGHFGGVTSVFPVRFCEVNTLVKDNLEWLAIAGISKYNLANKETEYEVVDVVSVNVHQYLQCRYYVTFNARDIKAHDGALKTFQAIVVADWTLSNLGQISDVVLCRPKLT